MVVMGYPDMNNHWILMTNIDIMKWLFNNVT